MEGDIYKLSLVFFNMGMVFRLRNQLKNIEKPPEELCKARYHGNINQSAFFAILLATVSVGLTGAQRSLMVVWREPGFANVLTEESLMNICFMSLWNFMLKGLQRSKNTL